MSSFVHILTVVSVIFALSLIGAIVCFRILKSSAVIKRKEYQAGGALAGFLLIFAALYLSYSQLINQAQAQTASPWTITGQVTLEGDSQDSAEVEISLLPMPPKALSAPGGKFRFDKISLSENEPTELLLEQDGYLPQTILINPEVAVIDEQAKRISLKEPIVLSRGNTVVNTADTNRGASSTHSTIREPASRSVASNETNNASLSGTILKYLRSRSPLGGAQIELRSPLSGNLIKKAFSNNEGKYHLADVAPGTYALVVRFGRETLSVISPRSAAVSLQPKQTRELVITVTESGRG